MINPNHTYRAVLRGFFEQRCQKNPNYSLRSFARDISIAPSSLSEVLSGRYNLSRRSALNIAKNLGFDDEETSIFCCLVDLENTRSKTIREKAAIRLKKFTSQAKYSEISLETFKIISDWYHFAIVELTVLDDFKYSIDWIAEQLDITPEQVSEAINRLIKLGFVAEEGGTLKPLKDFTSTKEDTPSEAIRSFHNQIINKALNSLHNETVNDREISSVVIAVRKKDLPMAKDMIRKFKRDFISQMQAPDGQDQVASLAIQFFGLTKPLNEQRPTLH